MDAERIKTANAAAEVILSAPPTAREWASRPGELIAAAYKVARAWHAERNEDHRLAAEFSEKGTLKYFMLSEGFMPHDEEDAKAILRGIFKENEQLRRT